MKELLDFWAPWCGPCKRMTPIVEELENELSDQVKIQKINVDEDPQKALDMGVFSIPTYIVMKDGVEVARKVGIMPKAELSKLIIAS